MRLTGWLSLLILIVSSSCGAADLFPLSVETPSGVRTFQVELADTREERNRGLMHRRAMPQDQGMLFDFHKEQNVSFWMENTLIPLDMIFARADGRIVHVHHRARPLDRRAIRSGEPVRWVLEINGGLARGLGIAPGGRLAIEPFLR